MYFMIGLRYFQFILLSIGKTFSLYFMIDDRNCCRRNYSKTSNCKDGKGPQKANENLHSAFQFKSRRQLGNKIKKQQKQNYCVNEGR